MFALILAKKHTNFAIEEFPQLSTLGLKVCILNTKDYLGKLLATLKEGILDRCSSISKAKCIYNKKTLEVGNLSSVVCDEFTQMNPRIL